MGHGRRGTLTLSLAMACSLAGFTLLALLGASTAQPCTDADTSWLTVDATGAPYLRLPSTTNLATGYKNKQDQQGGVSTVMIGYVRIQSGLEVHSSVVFVNSSDSYRETDAVTPTPGPSCGPSTGPPAPDGFRKTLLGGAGSASDCGDHPNPNHGPAMTCLWDDRYCNNTAGGQCGILESEIAEKCGNWDECAGVICYANNEQPYCLARGQIATGGLQHCDRYAYIKATPTPPPPPGAVFEAISYPQWGESDSCQRTGTPVAVDLSNTPFKLSNGTQSFQHYEGSVSPSNVIEAVCDQSNKTCTGSCGGSCGGCKAGPYDSVKLRVVDQHSFQCGVTAYSKQRASLTRYKCVSTMGGTAQQCVPTIGGFTSQACSQNCTIYQCLDGQCVQSYTTVGLVYSECERGCAIDGSDGESNLHDVELIVGTAAACLVVALITSLLAYRLCRRDTASDQKALLESILTQSESGTGISADGRQKILVDHIEDLEARLQGQQSEANRDVALDTMAPIGESSRAAQHESNPAAQ